MGAMNNGFASVLIIEPHPLMRDSLRAAISAEPDLLVVQPAGGNAETYFTLFLGEEGVLLLEHKPDIILLGIRNPGREDLQTLARLHAEWPSTPILALTSHELPGQEQEALRSGARAVLTKAVTREKLLEVLRELLNTGKNLEATRVFPNERSQSVIKSF